MRDNLQIVLGGTGGQGLVSTSVLIGTCATECGYKATQIADYGVTTVGGHVQAEVIISTKPVIYPRVTKPDIIIALTQDVYDKFSPMVKQDGILIYDCDYINGVSNNCILGFHISDTAIKANNIKGINMVTLGVVIKVTKLLPNELVEKYIMSEPYPDEINRSNMNSYRLGLSLGKLSSSAYDFMK